MWLELIPKLSKMAVHGVTTRWIAKNDRKLLFYCLDVKFDWSIFRTDNIFNFDSSNNSCKTSYSKFSCVMLMDRLPLRSSYRCAFLRFDLVNLRRILEASRKNVRNSHQTSQTSLKPISLELNSIWNYKFFRRFENVNELLTHTPSGFQILLGLWNFK